MPKICFVGDDLVQTGAWPRPHQKIFAELLAEAGLRPSDYKVVSPKGLIPSGFNLYVALGDEAARRLIPLWEGSAQQRRGYLFEGRLGKTLVTVHPDVAATVYVPWRPLLSYDLQRAKEHGDSPELKRPTRRVHVVGGDCTLKRALDELRDAERLAFDIEIYDAGRVSCVGFAPSASTAYVFPPRFLGEARRILEGPTRKVAQNGQFDLHFLLTREGIRVRNFCDDTLIAWHSCYPELAGKDDTGRTKSKRTHKSLAFLASLYTDDAWWKDYGFANDYEMYVLNGRDCCITFECMERLDEEIDRLDVRRIYEHEVGLVWPCVEMQSRGLLVDEELRAQRLIELDHRIDETDAKLEELVFPILAARLSDLPPEKQRLFLDRKVCACCRNGKGKKAACWGCEGLAKAPGKKAAAALGPCKRCDGRGEFVEYVFNALSSPQKQILLYDLLKLPKRMNQGKLSTDEDALKGLLSHVA